MGSLRMRHANQTELYGRQFCGRLRARRPGREQSSPNATATRIELGGVHMIEPAHPALAGWDTVYVIIGSSGAALIGLQFVVLALRPQIPILRSNTVVSAFGSPTIMHLVGALVVSVTMCAPWRSLRAVA